MKIAIMSDFHFGHGAGTELEEDSFSAVGEALDASMGCDLILMPGDLFDTRVPGTESLARAMQLMIKPSLAPAGARFVRLIGKDAKDISPRSFSGIPIIAIHGTHERRTRELMNPVEALERAGFAIHLHCSGAVFEKDGESVAIFGLSGVPDQYAGEELKKWGPRPEPGCYNIFMLHQNMREFMPPQIEHALRTDDLPGGFDLYVCGHIHESTVAKKGSKPFIFPGSLIPTQIDRESAKPRGFFIVDTRGGAIDFIEIEGQRKVYLIEGVGGRAGITAELDRLLSAGHPKKPIIRIRVQSGDEGLQGEIRSRYGDRALLSFKAGPEESSILLAAKTLEEHTLSVNELGRTLLEKNLRGLGLDAGLYESVFELISENREEEAERLVLGRGRAGLAPLAGRASEAGTGIPAEPAGITGGEERARVGKRKTGTLAGFA